MEQDVGLQYMKMIFLADSSHQLVYEIGKRSMKMLFINVTYSTLCKTVFLLVSTYNMPSHQTSTAI